MFYINYKDSYNNNRVETIDEADSKREARELVKEYKINGINAYISSRSTKDYKNRS